MKIIFSPAKDLRLDFPIEKDWYISAETEKIVAFLKNLDEAELQKALSLSPALLEQNLEHIKNFDKAVSYHAIDLYNGLAYRSLNVTDFSQNERKYLIKNLVLLSALYGPMQADSLIKAYRLDFNSKIKIDGQSLKAFWKSAYNSYFKKGERIINLASDEFSGLIDKSNFDWIDVSFLENKNGKLKKHSTSSKKGRGSLLRFMAKKNITTIDDLRLFNIDGYVLDEKLSTEKSFVFVR